MADYRNIDAKAQANAPKRQITRSALALAVVEDIQRKLDPDLMIRLRDAAVSADRTECQAAIKEALAAGTRREDLADFYIPELARQMGEDWCSDQLGFAGVTVGVSRLQSMLRDLGPEWSGDKSADAAAPAIMLIVPQDTYHTLGAMVLAGQLRRKGLSVRMMLGARPIELVARIKQTEYDAIFISSSRGETLESLRRIVDVVKTASTKSPPIVIGGTLLDVEDSKNVTTLTGADYATKRPNEALKLCGLATIPHAAVPLTHRT